MRFSFSGIVGMLTLPRSETSSQILVLWDTFYGLYLMQVSTYEGFKGDTVPGPTTKYYMFIPLPVGARRELVYEHRGVCARVRIAEYQLSVSASNRELCVEQIWLSAHP